MSAWGCAAKAVQMSMAVVSELEATLHDVRSEAGQVCWETELCADIRTMSQYSSRKDES